MATPENMVEEIRTSQVRSFVPADRERPSSAAKRSVSIKEAQPGQSSIENQVPEEDLLELVEQINSEIGSTNVTLKIQVDHETGENMVQVVDRETGEVIRQIPPEETVKLEARIEKMMGIFVDSTL